MSPLVTPSVSQFRLTKAWFAWVRCSSGPLFLSQHPQKNSADGSDPTTLPGLAANSTSKIIEVWFFSFQKGLNREDRPQAHWDWAFRSLRTIDSIVRARGLEPIWISTGATAWLRLSLASFQAKRAQLMRQLVRALWRFSEGCCDVCSSKFRQINWHIDKWLTNSKY